MQNNRPKKFRQFFPLVLFLILSAATVGIWFYSNQWYSENFPNLSEAQTPISESDVEPSSDSTDSYLDKSPVDERSGNRFATPDGSESTVPDFSNVLGQNFNITSQSADQSSASVNGDSLQTAITDVSEDNYDASKSIVIDNSNSEVYLGRMAIPDLNINLPIVKGVGEDNLFRGAATNKTEQTMGSGNYTLASHSTSDPDVLFSPLLKAQVGQMVYLTDYINLYEYRIVKLFIVFPKDVWILEDVEDKALLTMYTCATPEGDTRFVARGGLVDSYPVDDASAEVSELLQLF